MWKPRFIGIDPISGSAGAAVLCTIWTQHQSSRQAELCSETLCFIILPILFIVSRSEISTTSRAILSSKSRSQPASSRSLWIVAACLVTASCYKAEVGMIVLFPLLTPLILIAENHFRSELRASRIFDTEFFFPLVSTVWGTTLAALFAIFALSDWNVVEILLSALPAAALLIAYISFMPRNFKDACFVPLINVEEAIVPFSLRVVLIFVIALSIQTIAFGLPIGTTQFTISLGLAKALSWYFTIRTVCGLHLYQGTSRILTDSQARYISWCIATTIATFSIVSSRDPFVQSSEIQALLQVIASSLALSQIIHLLPKQARARSVLWVFIFVSLAPYLANVLTIRIVQSSVPPSFSHNQHHPVVALAQAAMANFEHLLRTQSKNYTAASANYRRRYNMDPPPGFEVWYEFAAANQSPIIDEFDTIFDAISPFWRLSGKEVIGIMSDVQNAPNLDLWLCAFSGDRAETQCSHPDRTFDRNIRLLFDTLLEDLRGVLPDVKFLVNHLDEPRVLVPPPSLKGGDSNGKGEFELTDLSRRPTWDAITKFCASQERNRSAWTANRVETFSLPFVTDRLSTMDLCQHPEYSSMHGLFMSPTSFRLIEGLVPILTTGSPSTMGDILFPSPAYIESGFQYDEAHDIDWDSKENKLYWAGSTTGGFSADNSWRHFHRQRFVTLAQNLDQQQHYYLRETDGVVARAKSSFLNGRLFNVAFTRIFQCATITCRDQRAYFYIKSWTDKDRALRSRLVFDIDGNGISGRYYKLLASKSVPLKQTLLKEWHDERLVPWVHYVPVSQGMEEIPELVFHLTSTEAGQQRARKIAEQGREWFSKALRDVDMAVYTYRLLLELARLQDPEREAS